MYSSASFTVSNSSPFGRDADAQLLLMAVDELVGVEAVRPEVLAERRIEGDLGLVDLEPVRPMSFSSSRTGRP